MAWMLLLLALASALAQPVPTQAKPAPVGAGVEETSAPKAQEPVAQNNTGALNLLGQTDAAGGEARRNENVQINLVDNNTARELNRRVGIRRVTEATLVQLQRRVGVGRAWLDDARRGTTSKREQSATPGYDRPTRTPR